MKMRLPIPFLILILAGIVSLCSLLMSWKSGAAAGGQSRIEVQTVEQERMADFYFRVLTAISRVSAKKPEVNFSTPQLPKDPSSAPVAKVLLLGAS
jgi:hypothetical protein